MPVLSSGVGINPIGILPPSLWNVAEPFLSLTGKGPFLTSLFMVAGVTGASATVAGLAGLSKNAVKENIGLLKTSVKKAAKFGIDLLKAPFRIGAKIGDALKVKPDDGLGKKILKRGVLGVAVPLAAVGLVTGAVPLIASAVSVLPILAPSVAAFGAKSLVAYHIASIAGYVAASGAGATFLAGMSKDTIKESFGSLKSSFRKKPKNESQADVKSAYLDKTDEPKLDQNKTKGAEAVKEKSWSTVPVKESWKNGEVDVEAKPSAVKVSSKFLLGEGDLFQPQPQRFKNKSNLPKQGL